jgi:hypothetical protein
MQEKDRRKVSRVTVYLYLSTPPYPSSHDLLIPPSSLPIQPPPPPSRWSYLKPIYPHPSKTNRQHAYPSAQPHGAHWVPQSHHTLCADTILCALTASIPIMQACLPCCVALHNAVRGDQIDHMHHAPKLCDLFSLPKGV